MRCDAAQARQTAALAVLNGRVLLLFSSLCPPRRACPLHAVHGGEVVWMVESCHPCPSSSSLSRWSSSIIAFEYTTSTAEAIALHDDTLSITPHTRIKQAIQLDLPRGSSPCHVLALSGLDLDTRPRARRHQRPRYLHLCTERRPAPACSGQQTCFCARVPVSLGLVFNSLQARALQQCRETDIAGLSERKQHEQQLDFHSELPLPF